MTEKTEYLIALFHSVSHVIRSERILLDAGIPHKIIPVPKKISTECGVCIRFPPKYREAIAHALLNKADIIEMREL